MSYYFNPPLVTYFQALEGDLVYPYDQGISVLVSGSTVTQKQYVTHEEAGAADFFYRGGMRHLISDAEAATLAAAGLSANIEGYP